MRLLAIDPGSCRSALVYYNTEKPVRGTFVTGPVESRFLIPNDEALGLIADQKFDRLIIEMIEGRGMRVGADVFRTCVWIGRFTEACYEKPVVEIYRRDIKLHVCGKTTAKDADIRQALIDFFGGDEGKTRAIGGVRCPTCKGKGWTGRKHVYCTKCTLADGWESAPGPCYSIVKDQWQALAVAVTYAARNRNEKGVAA